VQRRRIDVVDEGALVADLDDGQPLAVTGLELVVPVDLDLLEAVLAELRDERRASALAEMTTATAIEDDVTDRCREWSSPRRPV
jgi:hypothetical protein